MIIASLIAASFTFTATATGVAKGTPVEFMFAGAESDRDYETMFLIDVPVDEFCYGLEKAGVPRGDAQDIKDCKLWPVGCPLVLEPSIDESIERKPLPGGPTNPAIIYTGGTRDATATPFAASNMPMSVFSLYTLDQSPLLFDGIFEQGDVYGLNLAKMTIEKGKRYKFTLKWDEKTRPSTISVVFRPGNSIETLKSVKAAAEKGDLVVKASFSPELTINEAKAAANALALIDSRGIKVNGRDSDGFFFSRLRYTLRPESPDFFLLTKTGRAMELIRFFPSVKFRSTMQRNMLRPIHASYTLHHRVESLSFNRILQKCLRQCTRGTSMANNPSLHNPHYAQ